MNVFKKTIAAAAILAASATAAFSADIVDTAAGNEDFSTLVAAVKAAGLVETLKGEGPFTVFAPTDDAFAALPEGTVENLLKPENKDQLVAILTYHVVPGKVMSTDLTDDASVVTVQGSNVMIDLDNGPMVNDAKVVTADLETDNGVIHVIDKVIMPK
ncbi:MAG: fasciclin domain-containing protein [Pseudomonadota bacterium]